MCDVFYENVSTEFYQQNAVHNLNIRQEVVFLCMKHRAEGPISYFTYSRDKNKNIYFNRTSVENEKFLPQ